MRQHTIRGMIVFSIIMSSVLPVNIRAEEETMSEITENEDSGSSEYTNVTPVDIHRLYNKRTGEHFYTPNAGEKDALVKYGWRYEGTGWVAPSVSSAPVYRLYNWRAGEHHFTMNAVERDKLVSLGWNDEGIGWYSDTQKTVPIYREFNPRKKKCNHNFTSSLPEHTKLVSLGWRDEGTAWYGLKAGTPIVIVEPEKETYSYKVIYYSQRDSRWARKKYGRYYFGNTGCGVTSISMCVTAVLGREVRPDTVADYLYSIGSYSQPNHHGTTGKSRLHAAKHWNINCELLLTYADLRKALEDGKVISMAVRGQTEFMTNKGSHGLTLYGYKDGKTFVYDPWNQNKNAWYSLDYLWRIRSHVPADLDAGPEIVFAFWEK